MKIKFVISAFAFIIALALALNFISATVSITFPAYNATINSNGSVTYYNTTGNIQRVSDFDALSYRCSDSSCAAIIESTRNHDSTAGNSITVTFPTRNQNSTYAVYFYKTGYIGWEQIITNIPANLEGNFSGPRIFFAKKESGFAPIMNLSVQEEIPTGRPIRIGFNVSVDAETYSAIRNSGSLNFTPSQLEDYRQVQTLVTLEIKNSTNNLVYTVNKTMNISYSSSEAVEFDYPGFSQTGSYTVSVFTDVIDAKVLNSIRQSTSKVISVIPRNLTNYTFTLIQNLNYVPAIPFQGDNVSFSFSYSSGFVNETEDLLPANTTLNLTIYRNTNPVWNSIQNLGSNGTYTFSRIFNDTGNYRVVIFGSPNDARGNLSLSDSQEVSFVISSNSTDIDDDSNDDDSNEDDDDSDDSDNHNDSEKEVSNEISAESLPLTMAAANETIYLNSEPAKNQKSKYNVWLGILVIAILILLILIVLAYIVKYSN